MAENKKISEFSQALAAKGNYKIPVVDGNSNKYMNSNDLIIGVTSKTSDYSLTSNDFGIFISNPNTASQKGTLNCELPLLSSISTVSKYRIVHGSNEGLIKIRVNDLGSDKILYENNQLSYILLYSPGDSFELYSDGSAWYLNGNTIMQVGWINRSIWTSANPGNGVTYDNKSAAVDWTGMTFSDGTNTATIIYDSGGTGSSGELYFYNISGGTGVFTDGSILTSVNSDTAEVNEVLGTSKNVNRNLFHGFGNSEINNIIIAYNSTATYSGAFLLPTSSIDQDSIDRWWIIQSSIIDTNTMKIQTGTSGFRVGNNSGSADDIAGQDTYLNIKLRF